MRTLTINEITGVSGGDITWGDVGAAVGGVIGGMVGTGVGSAVGAAAGALVGKAVGEYFGCESSSNICNTNYAANLPVTYIN